MAKPEKKQSSTGGDDVAKRHNKTDDKARQIEKEDESLDRRPTGKGLDKPGQRIGGAEH